MKVLITGGAGFIGQHLRRELGGHAHGVWWDDLVVDGWDLRDEGVAHRQVGRAKFDVVIHLAAQVGRVFGEDDLERSITNNALATARVAQACADLGTRLVYCSTSEVYGDQGSFECFEGGPEVMPHGIYGLSKRWGEEAARLYAPRGLQIVRLSMPYGPGLPAGRGRAAIINFLHQAHHRMPITVHRGGERSWCWIGDTVKGFRMVVESGTIAMDARQSEDGVGVYNVGRDDNAVPMRVVAEMACDIAGAPRHLIREVAPPERQTVVKRLSTVKLRELGWKPSVDLVEGMERTYEVVRKMDKEGNVVR